MAKKLINAVLVLVLLAGMGLILYPTISEQWNKAHQTTAIAQYRDMVEEIDMEDAEQQLADARAYNEELAAASSPSAYVEEHMDTYNNLLNIAGTGIMGYVEVPKIKTTLPVYHGTDENVLQIAAGHVEWTSLPVGGEGSHSVLSGHRGLPSAKLFTDLDQMEEGDLFTVHVLGEKFYYKVDQITTVLPDDTNSLLPMTGEDYCTLVTCTPYGINTHRLLVRGQRTDYDDTYVGTILSEGSILPVWALSSGVGIAVLFLLLLGMLIFGKRA